MVPKYSTHPNEDSQRLFLLAFAAFDLDGVIIKYTNRATMDSTEINDPYFARSLLTHSNFFSGGLSARISNGKIGVEYASCQAALEGTRNLMTAGAP